MYDRNLKSTTRYTTQDGLPSNVIYRIEEDPKGHMWISTTNGLAVLNPVNQEIKVFKKEHGLLSNQFNYNSSLKAKTTTGRTDRRVVPSEPDVEATKRKNYPAESAAY